LRIHPIGLLSLAIPQNKQRRKTMMQNCGKCPKCDGIVNSIKVEHVDVTVNHDPKWHGVSYLCPHCDTILSVGIDPMSPKKDKAEETFDKLRDR
jgi:hypothetical protein